MKLAKSLIVVTLGSLLLLHCQKFNPADFEPPKVKKPRTEDSGRSGESEFKPVKRIEDFDIGELRKTIKDAGSYKNCMNYDSGSPSISFTPLSKGPKNCLAYAVDSQLGPICEYEDQLDDFDCGGDESCEDKIDGLRDELELTKDDVIDQLYELAYEIDEEVEEIEEDLEEEDTWWSKLGEVLVRSELGGYVRYLEGRANSICGWKIDLSRGKKKSRSKRR